MKARLDGILARYGQDVVLTDRDSGEARDVRAFVQPILKKREDPGVQATPLGAVSRERWLYIGSGAAPLRPGDGVACGGMRLRVQESRAVPWGGGTLYYWALLRPGKETEA